MLHIIFDFEREDIYVDDTEQAAHVLIDYGVMGPIYPMWLPGASKMLRYHDSKEYQQTNVIFMNHEEPDGVVMLSADDVAAINYELQRLGYWITR